MKPVNDKEKETKHNRGRFIAEGKDSWFVLMSFLICLEIS